MNNVNLIGRIASDPTLKQGVTNDKKWQKAFFQLAVPQSKDSKSVDFIPCLVWNKDALNLVQRHHKGEWINIIGRLHSYTMKKNNEKKFSMTVVVEHLSYFDAVASQVQAEPQKQPTKQPLKQMHDVAQPSQAKQTPQSASTSPMQAQKASPDTDAIESGDLPPEWFTASEMESADTPTQNEVKTKHIIDNPAIAKPKTSQGIKYDELSDLPF